MEPMRDIPIAAFGSQGLASDQSEHTRTPRQLSQATNVRIQDGVLSSIPAMVETHTFIKTPIWAMPFYMSDDSGGHIIFFADFTIEYVDSTGAITNLTPNGVTGEVPSNANYFGVQVGDMLLITNGVQLPWQITQAEILAGNRLYTMPNWPANYRCRLLEVYKGFVFAAGITIDAIDQRSMVKWSHPFSPGDTELYWDHTTQTLLAGENVPVSPGRNVMAMQVLGDQLMIYMDQSVTRCSYVGGGLIFDFAKTSIDDGCVGPRAVASYDTFAIVVGFSDIYRHDGFSKLSLSDGKITRRLYRNAAIDSTIQAAYYPERREVFILHKESESYTQNNSALIYNIENNAFTLMRLPGPDNTGGACAMYLGSKFAQTDTSYTEAGAAGWTYDNSGLRTYNSIRTSDENLDFCLVSTTAKNIEAFDLQDSIAHDPTNIYAECIKIDMVPLFGSTGDKIKYISRIFPQATSDGSIELSFGVAMLPTNEIEWKPWVRYDMATDWAVDQRAAGRYLGVRMRNCSDCPQMFSLTGFDFELMFPDAGRR